MQMVNKGSMKRDLQDNAIDIFTFCAVNCIFKSDTSKRFTFLKVNYWGIACCYYYYFLNLFLIFEVVWFAAEHNAKTA